MSDANRLYFGDCLDVMRQDIPSESVDLVYLDPPFNSKRLYNAFIGDAQWVAFDDTWQWSEAINDFDEVAGQPQYKGIMEGLRMMLGTGPQLAYLSYMANRLVECHRVLKPTGSIYLHCDPTMSHYLKTVMDGIFGKANFRNEIVWYYPNKLGTGGNTFDRQHDSLLVYVLGKKWTHNALMRPVRNRKMQPVTQKIGGKRVWLRDSEGKRVYAMSRAETKLGNVWEVPIINPMAKERRGYPTQKPLKLLERIIRASSNEGDVVLDPFCGCGTTIHAAQNLGRRWIGIDVCVNACKEIESRLKGHFDSLWADVEFIGMPKTRDDARFMAGSDPFRFERWAASLVDGMEANKKQRGDGGIDGRGRLPVRRGQFIDIVSQVKGGKTGVGDIRDFNGSRQQAGADLGIFTCFDDRVTDGMKNTAANAGRFMQSPIIQIYTIEDYFDGRRPVMPVLA